MVPFFFSFFFNIVAVQVFSALYATLGRNVFYPLLFLQFFFLQGDYINEII